MTFTDSNTVKAHLRNLVAGAASVRSVQLSHGLVRTDNRIADFGWKHVAPADPHISSARFGSASGRAGQMQ